ncbi:MAG TPA: indole-3-glycerol phosphate synthase TrpC [Thermomicrobiales bacterium]|nr:indole-3-glycerol phosphate synthase TrpC [Thermomicrobiales bacterium]
MSSGVAVATGTILDRILARTFEDVALRKSGMSLSELAARADAQPTPLSLRDAITRSVPAVIAEIKRGSPSKGVFPVDVDPPDVARAYLEGGAAALSVLTDQPFFGGSLADLEAVARVAHGYAWPAPVLRKDFILDRFQLLEARAHGADAVLLIVAALGDGALDTLFTEATRLGMDVLVEVHDEAELERALRVGATLVGVNNRDLKTFAVDLSVTERIAREVPSHVVLVSESGISGRFDVERVHQAGAHAVLVGESLVLSEDRTAAVRALVGT